MMAASSQNRQPSGPWQCRACGAALDAAELHQCPNELPRSLAEHLARLEKMRAEGCPADGVHVARSGALTHSWCGLALTPYTWVLLEDTIADAKPGQACPLCLEVLERRNQRRS